MIVLGIVINISAKIVHTDTVVRAMVACACAGVLYCSRELMPMSQLGLITWSGRSRLGRLNGAKEEWGGWDFLERAGRALIYVWSS